LKQLIGPGTPPRDVALANVVVVVPPSGLPAHPLISRAPDDRVRHARGQSLSDWIALRSGRVGVFPDGVAYPTTAAEVRDMLGFAAAAGARIIPYGGGTSVVGHINPQSGAALVLTVDMSRMNRLRRLDETNRLATFGAGVAGPDLEAQLRAQGYTLGHFPQSFEYSTLGGWIATRSSGQQSLGYGRIEQLFAGGQLEAPGGTLVLPCFPAASAGPDLREMVLGSEGRIGILTEATVRVRRLPERQDFYTVFFPDWERGLAAVRQIVQAELALSMLRLSTAAETEMTLALAGHQQIVGALERLLALRGLGSKKCMLLVGLAGDDTLVKFTRRVALDIAGKQGGVRVGRAIGRQWVKSRFRAPYLRNVLWEMGYAVDTVETAVEWTRVPAMVDAVGTALRTGLADRDERVHAFTHLSHIYPSGSSVYTTYVYRLAPDPDETLQRWQALKAAASQAIVAQGGTISHQHGVGVDHLPYLAREKGDLGVSAIRALCERFDPQGLLNPGKLVE
jgi:alkyldihydroxyacetonephosphate synthase